MRVIHIIPSAFDYFDDIRAAAFDVVEKSAKFGIEAEAFTLQYESGASRATQAAVRSSAPSREYKGMGTIDDVIASLDSYDVVHLHAPFLGAASRLLAWRKEHAAVPFVVTYYRSVPWTNMFSLFIRAYNGFYLPRILKQADAVIFQPIAPNSQAPRDTDMLRVDDTEMFENTSLTDLVNEVQLDKGDYITAKYALVYGELMKQTHGV